MSNNLNRSLLIILAFLLVVTNSYWALQTPRTRQEASNTNLAVNYPYLSKRIFAENQNDIVINFQPLRKELEREFTTLPQSVESSFYFEYLPSGTSVRIGDDNELIAASLIKVPLVMNLYKAAELGRINLDSDVTLIQEDLDEAYGELWRRGEGAKITLRKAAQETLSASDNTASHLIFRHIHSLLNEKEQSLAQLDIDQNMKDGQAVITAKSYSSILKSLYLASFNSRANSQEILTYLTQSTETRRLTASLPKTVTVAHKNGVYNAQWAESDCGIVYADKRPYSICVMVGLPEPQASEFIASISKIVYEYVISQ